MTSFNLCEGSLKSKKKILSPKSICLQTCTKVRGKTIEHSNEKNSRDHSFGLLTSMTFYAFHIDA